MAKRYEYCEKLNPSEDQLNKLGAKGWQLVLVQRKGKDKTYYFRRELPDLTIKAH